LNHAMADLADILAELRRDALEAVRLDLAARLPTSALQEAAFSRPVAQGAGRERAPTAISCWRVTPPAVAAAVATTATSAPPLPARLFFAAHVDVECNVAEFLSGVRLAAAECADAEVYVSYVDMGGAVVHHRLRFTD
jgi:hypothetical protein